MKKLIFFILLALTPALASAEIEINNIVNGEIVVLKTETVYTDGTVCKIVAVQVPRFNIEKVEVECFQPAVEGGGGGDTDSNNTTDSYNTTASYEDNDTYNFEENNIDNSNTHQNGATVNISR